MQHSMNSISVLLNATKRIDDRFAFLFLENLETLICLDEFIYAIFLEQKQKDFEWKAIFIATILQSCNRL